MSKKDPIPRGYLRKKGGAWRPVRLMDVCTLLYNMQKAAASEDVGYEDTNISMEMMQRRLNRELTLDPSTIESLLWCSNMLHEKGEFQDVKGRDFDTFVKDVLRGDDIHRVYGWIVKKGDK